LGEVNKKKFFHIESPPSPPLFCFDIFIFMKRIIRLTESDLINIVKRVISEQNTPEEWESEIRKIESQIGNPSKWYKKWRETTPEGQAVNLRDKHNEEGEYIVNMPPHLRVKKAV